MKKSYHMSFDDDETRPGLVRRLVETAGCLEYWSEDNEFMLPHFSNSLDEKDPRRSRLTGLLRQYKIAWLERLDVEYSDAELREAPLLTIGYNRSPILSGGAEDGTTYDLSKGCPKCGTGAIQMSPLKVKPSHLPKRYQFAGTATGELLIRTELAGAFKNAGVTGAEFRQARSRHENKSLPWWQIIPQYTLPKMSRSTPGHVTDTYTCKKCRRDGHAFLSDVWTYVVYSSKDVSLTKLPDIVATWECFGRSVLHDDPDENLVQGFAQPLILVKQMVFEIMRKHKVKTVDFEPVIIK